MSEGKKLRILREVLGDSYRSGEEHLFSCPKCGHHKKKLSVNVSKNVYKCWVCDWSGRNLRRVVRFYGDLNHKREWSKLTNHVDTSQLTEDLFEETPKEKEQTVKLPESFESLANKDIKYGDSWPLKYLRMRGITKSDIVRWKIGYCSTGEFAERIIIPSFGLTGHANYFVARSYMNDWKKYMNPPVGRDIIFNHLFTDFDNDISLVEGAFDAIVAGPNAIPLLGSTLRETSRLFQEIAKNDSTVFIALDPDAEKKAMRLIKSLLQYGIEVYKVDIEGYSDVGEMTKAEYQERKENASLINFDSYLLKTVMTI
jgi:DNA primase